MSFDWNEEKNQKLIIERDISFEEIETAIEEGKLLDIIENPNKLKHQGQKVFVVEIQDYAYLVPFVESETSIFLKTVIPNRKATKEYLIKRKIK